MDAKLQKIQITPTKRDSEGCIKTPEAAVVAFEMPLNSVGQKEELVALLELLTDEWFTLTIVAKQMRLKMVGDSGGK